MHKRWMIYIIVGLVFGLADWYFLEFLASFSRNPALNDAIYQSPWILQLMIVAVIVLLNYGVWLIPVIPVSIYEMRYSQSIWRAALTAMLVWSTALISYYAYYSFLLMFVGLPNLGFMLYSNHLSTSYWLEWWPPFRRVIVDQLMEWIGIPLIAGSLVGFLSAYIYKRVSTKQDVNEMIEVKGTSNTASSG